MFTLRPAAARGHFDHGWLKTWHSFSFAGYQDEAHMGFGPLRVINEDIVSPGMGFATHGHSDMEIVTYVLSGALEHKDSLGHGSVIRPGEVQYMRAGTGIRHSEVNPSDSEAVHLLQIWLLPSTTGLKPGYEQMAFEPPQNSLRLLASGLGIEGALPIHSPVTLYAGRLGAGQKLAHGGGKEKLGWLQLISGELALGGVTMKPGDGAAISCEADWPLQAVQDAHFLLFDMERV